MKLKVIYLSSLHPIYKIIETNNADLFKVKKKLEHTQEKIIKILKDYKKAGLIKSIFIPKNKKMQKYLDGLVNAKRQIKDDLRIIKKLS